MNARMITTRPAVGMGDGGGRRRRTTPRVAALVDSGASNLELVDGFTMKAPELLGSG